MVEAGAFEREEQTRQRRDEPSLQLVHGSFEPDRIEYHAIVIHRVRARHRQVTRLVRLQRARSGCLPSCWRRAASCTPRRSTLYGFYSFEDRFRDLPPRGVASHFILQVSSIVSCRFKSPESSRVVTNLLNHPQHRPHHHPHHRIVIVC